MGHMCLLVASLLKEMMATLWSATFPPHRLLASCVPRHQIYVYLDAYVFQIYTHCVTSL